MEDLSEDRSISMFRIRRNKGEETLEFVGFKPIYESEEWELLHVNKHQWIFWDAPDTEWELEDGFGRTVLGRMEYKLALETGLASIEVDKDEFDYDDDYELDTIYTKLTEELEAEELRLLP